MAASDFISTVQGMYVAYYGRFADQAGLTYWSQQLDAAKGDQTQIINAFGNSDEAKDLFGTLANDAKIEKLYSNLFNHAADAAGKAYYLGLLEAGTATSANIAKIILDGTFTAGNTGNDAYVLGSKLVAAKNLSDSVDPLFYAGDAAVAAARTLISGVTSSATAAAATAAVFTAAVDTVINPPAPTEAPVTPAVTESLTAGRDSVKGGAADDYFFATEGTLTAFDVVAAGAGNDMLSVAVSANTDAVLTGFKTTDLETIEVKALGTGTTTLDMADVNMTAENKQTAVTVATRESADGRTINVTNIQDIGMTNIKIEDTAATHNFNYDAQADQDNGTETEMQLIENRGTTINFATEGASSEVTSMKLTSTRDVENTANIVTDLNVGTAFASMTIDGNASLAIVEVMDASLHTVDASAHDINLATAAPMVDNFALTMNMSAVNAGDVNFKGSQDNTSITFGTAANTKTIETFGGNDKVIAGEGNNTVALAAGNDTVTAGAGNDNVTAGAGNDSVTVGDGNNTVDAGTGNDTVTAGAGNDDITAGEGDDVISAAEGNNKVTGDAGNDLITTGTGKDTVTAGEGDDTLNDLAGNNTIDMGAGDDTVVIGTATVTGGIVTGLTGGEGDNSITLGTGDDTLGMTAKEYSVADTVAGGEGADTLVFFNATGYIPDGLITRSESQNTSSIETFDLRDSNINLSLTNELYATAANNAITVTTEQAKGTSTVNMLAVDAPAHSLTLAGGTAQDIVIVNDAFFNGKSTLAFGNVAATPAVTTTNAVPATTVTTTTTAPSTNSASNQTTTTTTTSTTTTTVTTTVAQPTDILRVVDSATIRVADMEKITGLERIELTSQSGDAAQTWAIELTSNFSGTIWVSPLVATGTKLYIDAAKVGTANVNILRNSNVSVLNLDGTAFVGTANVTVGTHLDFTSNGDNLVGTGVGDIFSAASLGTMNPSDTANGMAGSDELKLGFAVYQGNTVELRQQLNNAQFASIETLSFDDQSGGVNSGVNFQYTTDLAGTQDFRTFNLTVHNDDVRVIAKNVLAADGVTLNTNAGDDTVRIDGTGATTVNASSGNDTVIGNDDANTIAISNVETVNTNLGNDVVTMLNGFAVTMDGGAGTDVLNGSAEADTITAANVETINANDGDDTVTVSTGTTVNAGKGNDTVTGSDAADVIDGNDGNDVITAGNGNNVVTAGAGDDTVTTGTGNDIVSAGTGNDTITTGAGNDIVDAGAGDDTITSGAGNDAIAGREGNDTIDLTSNGASSSVVVYGKESAHTTNSMTVDSGVDTVTGFEAGHVAGTNDYIDLTAMLGSTSVTGIDVVSAQETAASFIDLSVVNNHAKVGVVWNVQGDITTESAIANNYFFSQNKTPITGAIAKIANDGEAVIAYTDKVDGDNVASVKLAYVADTDAGDGQTWVVTQLGTVTFDYLTGLNGGTFDDNFIVNTAAAAAAGSYAPVNKAGAVVVANAAASLVDTTLPTEAPTTAPTEAPTGAPTDAPTDAPTTPTASVAVTTTGSVTDTAAVNTTYTVTAGTTYTYAIAGFGAGDELVFPAGNTPSIVNDDWTDGIVDLTYASSGTVTTIRLTGLSTANDGALNALPDFNTVFGAGTIA